MKPPPLAKALEMIRQFPFYIDAEDGEHDNTGTRTWPRFEMARNILDTMNGPDHEDDNATEILDDIRANNSSLNDYDRTLRRSIMRMNVLVDKRKIC